MLEITAVVGKNLLKTFFFSTEGSRASRKKNPLQEDELTICLMVERMISTLIKVTFFVHGSWPSDSVSYITSGASLRSKDEMGV